MGQKVKLKVEMWVMLVLLHGMGGVESAVAMKSVEEIKISNASEQYLGITPLLTTTKVPIKVSEPDYLEAREMADEDDVDDESDGSLPVSSTTETFFDLATTLFPPILGNLLPKSSSSAVPETTTKTSPPSTTEKKGKFLGNSGDATFQKETLLKYREDNSIVPKDNKSRSDAHNMLNGATLLAFAGLGHVDEPSSTTAAPKVSGTNETLKSLMDWAEIIKNVEQNETSSHLAQNVTGHRTESSENDVLDLKSPRNQTQVSKKKPPATTPADEVLETSTAVTVDFETTGDPSYRTETPPDVVEREMLSSRLETTRPNYRFTTVPESYETTGELVSTTTDAATLSTTLDNADSTVALGLRDATSEPTSAATEKTSTPEPTTSSPLVTSTSLPSTTTTTTSTTTMESTRAFTPASTTSSTTTARSDEITASGPIVDDDTNKSSVIRSTQQVVTTSTAMPSISTPTQSSAPVLGPTESSPNQSASEGADVKTIIVASLSVVGVVALILLIGFLYVIRKRQKQVSYGQRCRPVSLDAYSLSNVSVYNSVRRKANKLRLSKRSYGNSAFEDPVFQNHLLSIPELANFIQSKYAVYDEFKEIPVITSKIDEIPPGCEDKNRYANVIPLTETRVYLQRIGDDEKTEYINANYVKGPDDSTNYYIATQAPMENTVNDFWRMVWEQNCKVIIMATDLTEGGIEKCSEYMPPSVVLDNVQTYGNFQVTLKSREVKEKYALSMIHVKNLTTRTWREIAHFWYSWPESGVPSDETSVIAMLIEARSYLRLSLPEQIEESNSTSKSSNNNEEIELSEKKPGMAEFNSMEKNRSLQRSQGPLLVFCSPGTSRTGTIIACDCVLRKLEIPPRQVDIPQILYTVRRGRAGAVQTKQQYEFIYKVAHVYATKLSGPNID